MYSCFLYTTAICFAIANAAMKLSSLVLLFLKQHNFRILDQARFHVNRKKSLGLKFKATLAFVTREGISKKETYSRQTRGGCSKTATRQLNYWLFFCNVYLAGYWLKCEEGRLTT